MRTDVFLGSYVHEVGGTYDLRRDPAETDRIAERCREMHLPVPRHVYFSPARCQGKWLPGDTVVQLMHPMYRQDARSQFAATDFF